MFDAFLKLIPFMQTLLEVILFFHRRKGIHTSGIVWMYTLLIVICGVPTVYTYYFVQVPHYLYQIVSYSIYFIMTLILFILCCFADSQPIYTSSLPSTTLLSPELRASFLSKLTFWWLNSLVITGYRKSLVTSDLYSLKEEDKTVNIIPKFDKNWSNQIQHDNDYANKQLYVSYDTQEKSIKITNKTSKSNPGIIKALFGTFGLYFLSGGIAKLGHDILQFISPLLLK